MERLAWGWICFGDSCHGNVLDCSCDECHARLWVGKYGVSYNDLATRYESVAWEKTRSD